MKTSLDNSLLLDNITFPRKTIATKVITFLSLILTLNNLVFDCRNYIQIRGCAIGTICPPSYGNIFLDHFKRKCCVSVFTRTFINLSIDRFIDVIFFISTGSKEQLIRNLDQLNTKHNSIKLE